MAAPFTHEYLDKLKSFVDFVSKNPLILNMPQLDFFKRFIEQFGGKIPEGEYQMIKADQYQFRDAVKNESSVQMVINNTNTNSNSNSNNNNNNNDDDDNDNDDGGLASSKLLMEDTSMTAGNIVYLEETRYKRCKNHKIKKSYRKSKSKNGARAPKRYEKDFVKSKITLQNDNSEKDKVKLQNDNDPLCVDDNKPFKSEWLEKNLKALKRDADVYGINEDDDGDENAEKDFELNTRDIDDAEDDDDEPLIMIIRRRGRPSKFINKDDWTNDVMMKTPRPVTCREICKQKCVERFTEIERQEMCNHFWSLSIDERILYIRTHSKAKRFTRLKRKRERKRGNNCVYFLHIPSKSRITDAIRVCRSYFEATLCLTHYNIKKALDGYEPEPEEILIKKPTIITRANEIRK